MNTNLQNYLSPTNSLIQYKVPVLLKWVITLSVGLVAFLFLSGYFIKIDKIISASGTLRTGSNVQTIYAPFDIKVINQIKGQGDLVRIRETAFEIDELQYRNSIEMIETQLFKLKRVLNLLLLRVGHDHPAIPKNIERFIMNEMAVSVATSDELLAVEKSEVISLLALQNVLQSSSFEIDRKLSYERERLFSLNQVDEGIYSKNEIFEQQKIVEELTLELMSVQAKEIENQNKIRSAKFRVLNFDSELVEPMIEEIYNLYGELLELESKLNYSKQVQYFLLLGAEYDSYIEKVHISKGTHSVREGEPIYDIIRTFSIEDFFVQTVLSNIQISWVSVGDRVKLNLLSGGRDLGYIDGEIEVISNSSSAHNGASGFLVKVGLIAYDHVKIDEPLLILRPGLEVNVNIQVGERRVLDYFLEPFKEVKKKAFTEPSEI